MFKIFLYNLLFFILLVSLVQGNREDPNVTNDWGISDAEESTNVSEKNSSEEVWKLIEEGEYESSKNILKKLIDQNNENPEAWNLLGYIERQMQNFNKSLKYYNKALLLNPEYIPAHHYIAITYLEIGNLERFDVAERGSSPVLYLEVKSPGMKALHEILVDVFGSVKGVEGENYIPHITIARGGGVRDVDFSGFSGPTIWTAETLEFWNRDKRKKKNKVILDKNK